MRKSKQDKAVEAQVNAAFKQHGTNVEIPLLSITGIYKAGRDAAAAGQSVDDAVRLAIEAVRTK